MNKNLLISFWLVVLMAVSWTAFSSYTPVSALNIADGTVNTILAAVKAASTAPTATDPALVVTQGPNGTTPDTATGAFAAIKASTAASATVAAQTAIESAPGTSAGTAAGVQGVTGGLPVPVSGTVTVSNPGTSPTNYSLETGGNLAAILTQITKDAYNNAPYMSATPMTVATAATPGRSFSWYCPAAQAAVLSLTLASSGTLTWTIGSSGNATTAIVPISITQYSITSGSTQCVLSELP